MKIKLTDTKFPIYLITSRGEVELDIRLAGSPKRAVKRERYYLSASASGEFVHLTGYSHRQRLLARLVTGFTPVVRRDTDRIVDAIVRSLIKAKLAERI